MLSLIGEKFQSDNPANRLLTGLSPGGLKKHQTEFEFYHSRDSKVQTRDTSDDEIYLFGHASMNYKLKVKVTQISYYGTRLTVVKMVPELPLFRLCLS